jgi:hypothetical protein
MAEWRMMCMARSIRRLQLMWCASVGQAKIEATLRFLALFESRQTLQLRVVVDFNTSNIEHMRLVILPSVSRVCAILRNILFKDAEISSLVFERKREFIADELCAAADLPHAFSLVDLAARWPVFRASIEAVIASVERSFDEAQAKAEPLQELVAAMEHVSDPKAVRHLDRLEQCNQLDRGTFIHECIKEWRVLRQWSKDVAATSDHEVFCIGILRIESSPIRLKLVPKLETVWPHFYPVVPCSTLSYPSSRVCGRTSTLQYPVVPGRTQARDAVAAHPGASLGR